MAISNQQDALVNRSQMIRIAHEHNLFVSRGTIHRWANEPDFPMPVGKEGKFLLYSNREYRIFLLSKLKRIQIEH